MVKEGLVGLVDVDLARAGLSDSTHGKTSSKQALWWPSAAYLILSERLKLDPPLGTVRSRWYDLFGRIADDYGFVQV